MKAVLHGFVGLPWAENHTNENHHLSKELFYSRPGLQEAPRGASYNAFTWTPAPADLPGQAESRMAPSGVRVSPWGPAVSPALRAQ